MPHDLTVMPPQNDFNAAELSKEESAQIFGEMIAKRGAAIHPASRGNIPRGTRALLIVAETFVGNT